MITWIARVAMALASLLVLARAAAAHEPAPLWPDRAAGQECCATAPVAFPPAYSTVPAPTPAHGYYVVETCCVAAPPRPPVTGCPSACGDYREGYVAGYVAGYPRGAAEAQIFVQEQDGRWRQVSGEQSDSRYDGGRAYRPPAEACCAPPPAPPPCGACCGQGYPVAPPVCSGEVHLGDSFFWGGGGVGPEVVYSGGGGGGGYVYAGAAAGASSWASASASARVTVGRGGGHRPPPRPRHPPRKGGGCGCH